MALHNISYEFTTLIFFLWSKIALLWLDRLIFEMARTHTIKHKYTHTHKRWNASEQVISSSQRPLPTQHATDTWDEHPCNQWDSYSQYQQPSGLRLSP